MTQQEGNELANHFSLAAMGMPMLVDFMTFATKISQETHKFDQLIRNYDLEIKELGKQFRERHTGIFKYFQPYAKMAPHESCLHFQEFS